MSKRKGIFIRIDDETKKSLEKLAAEKDMSVTEFTVNIIMRTLEHKTIDDYDVILDACPLLLYMDKDEAPPKKGEGFYCMEKVPLERKLGSGLKASAEKYCSKCSWKKVFTEYKQQIILQKREGVKLDMHRCLLGGYLNDDGRLMYCTKIGRFRPIIERKKKTEYKPCYRAVENNARCPELKSITVIRGLKEKDNR